MGAPEGFFRLVSRDAVGSDAVCLDLGLATTGTSCLDWRRASCSLRAASRSRASASWLAMV